MKYKPGQLVEIIGTISTDPRGRYVQTLSPEYIGQLGLVIRYDPGTLIYHVLVGSKEDTLEVYEQEVKLVNG